jgi:hypothetical protein
MFYFLSNRLVNKKIKIFECLLFCLKFLYYFKLYFRIFQNYIAKAKKYIYIIVLCDLKGFKQLNVHLYKLDSKRLQITNICFWNFKNNEIKVLKIK